MPPLWFGKGVMHEQIPQTGSPDGVRCVPLPAWVEHAPYALQTPEAGEAYVANGVGRLLSDSQVDLTSAENAWHYRSAQRVLTRAGAERAAHFVAEFDPACERLDVHFIRVLRGADVIDHAKPGAIQTFRRETSLERLVLNGRLTASLLIPDVRVDDIVEIAVTVYGSNPVLGGKYANWAGFDSFSPWLDMRHRLLRPLTRHIAIKPFNEPPPRETTVTDDVEESRWRIVGQKRREAEDFTPPWLILTPALQCTEFHSWNEVARLFAPFYDSTAIPDALAAEIDQLAAAHQDPAARAAEWLRVVQDKLRYFALSLGEGGLVPRGLDAIWTSRLGDCKDAALLYGAGARRMGLDVCAALVSTTHGLALDTFLPSPSVFNHCIVRLRLNGRSFWLDPTIPAQAGSLDNISQPHAGWALALAANAEQLEKLGDDAPLHYLNRDDELRFGPKRESPVKLRRQTEYRFAAADSMRNRIANEGTTEYAKQVLNDMRAHWPNIVEGAPMEIRDDPVKNCITAISTYEIRNIWKQAEKKGLLDLEINDTLMPQELGQLSGPQRQTPIYLGNPRKITCRVRMIMPRRWSGDGWHHGHLSPGLSYSSRLTIEGPVIQSSKELVVEAWSVPPTEADAYRELTAKLRENLLIIWARERFGKIRPRTQGSWANKWWWYVIIIWGLLAVARCAASVTQSTHVPQ
jgi:hypothetical protein